MYWDSEVDVYTRVQNLTSELKARTVKLHPIIKTLTTYIHSYDTLSEIGKRKRKFVWRAAKVKLRSIVLRTYTCGAISHRYRNKRDVAERGEGAPEGEGPGGRSEWRGPSPWSRGGTPFGGFSTARRGTIKCKFTAAPQVGKKRFLCLFQIIFFSFNFIFANIFFLKFSPNLKGRFSWIFLKKSIFFLHKMKATYV